MKKLTSLLLAFALAFGLTGAALTVNAAGEATRGDVRDAFPKVEFKGYPDGLMHWDDLITRAQVATLLARAEKLEDVSANYFPDVTEDQWFYGAVNAVRKAGLFIGHDTGLFGPDEYMTLEQVAIVLSRYVDDREFGDAFGDGNVSKETETSDGWIIKQTAFTNLSKSTDLGRNQKVVTTENTFTIDAGVTLTLNNNSQLASKKLVVKGTLILNAESYLFANDLEIAEGGVVRIAKDNLFGATTMNVVNKGKVELYGDIKEWKNGNVLRLLGTGTLDKNTGSVVVYSTALFRQLGLSWDSETYDIEKQRSFLKDGNLTITTFKDKDGKFDNSRYDYAIFLNGNMEVEEGLAPFMNNRNVSFTVNGKLTLADWDGLNARGHGPGPNCQLILEKNKSIVIVDSVSSVPGKETVTYTNEKDKKGVVRIRGQYGYGNNVITFTSYATNQAAESAVNTKMTELDNAGSSGVQYARSGVGTNTKLYIPDQRIVIDVEGVDSEVDLGVGL